MQRYKFPKIYHVPWSLGLQNDDRMMEFKEWPKSVLTVKMDGENTSIYSDGYVHARSMSSAAHDSRNHLKAIAAGLVGRIPNGWRICGENLWAKHSIHYSNLESLFQVFAIFDENNVCLSWQSVCNYCAEWGLQTVPVIRVGYMSEKRFREMCALFKRGPQFCGGDEMEGFVLRNAYAFPYEFLSENMIKFVRAGHVQTDKHWMYQRVIRNESKS